MQASARLPFLKCKEKIGLFFAKEWVTVQIFGVCVRFFPALFLLVLAAGCSKIPPLDEGFVERTIADRIHIEWRQGLISTELTPDAAIQIALLNNPKVQATFEELGIARADLVEAGLLSNPSFAVEVRYPHVSHLRTNIEYLITSSLLDLFLIPLRKRLARTEFEQTKLRVSNEILDLAFEVRETYYELIAERKKIEYIHSSVELTSILRDIFSKQIAVGNVNSLQFQLAQARFLEAELELSRSQTEAIRLREKLNRLLGFSEDVCLLLPEDLPAVEACDFELCTLESRALEQRLDLQVARFEMARLTQMLGLKEGWTYTDLRAGLAGERDPDGTNLIGPGFSGEIPIFNYGQAARMRLFAQLRQTQERLAELEVRVLSEVREAHRLLTSYLSMIQDYEVRLLPMQGEITASSEELYNEMGLGVDQLLENKRLEVTALQNYTEIVKKSLVARVELDRALGGNCP